MTFKDSEVEKAEFPYNYELHIIGRGLDIREYKPPYIGMEDIVERLLRHSRAQKAYRNYLIWELRWVFKYSSNDLAILCGMSVRAVRAVLSRIDDLVLKHRDEWWNGGDIDALETD